MFGVWNVTRDAFLKFVGFSLHFVAGCWEKVCANARQVPPANALDLAPEIPATFERNGGLAKTFAYTAIPGVAGFSFKSRLVGVISGATFRSFLEHSFKMINFLFFLFSIVYTSFFFE